MRIADALSRVYCLQIGDSLNFRLKEALSYDDWIRSVGKALENGPYAKFYIGN